LQQVVAALKFAVIKIHFLSAQIKMMSLCMYISYTVHYVCIHGKRIPL